MLSGPSRVGREGGRGLSTASQQRPYLPGTELEMMEGELVRLRVFTYEDVARRAKWPRYVEPEYSHLNLDLRTESRREMWWRERRRQREPFWFAVDTLDGEMVGEETLREVDRVRKTARLGIHLSPAWVGKGLGTDAVRVLLRYLFDLLHYDEMKLDVAAHNRRAMRSYEKLGFEVVGSFWRMHPWVFTVLTDPRCVHLRPWVKMEDGLEVMKHWEMRLPVEVYRRRSSGDVGRESRERGSDPH